MDENIPKNNDVDIPLDGWTKDDKYHLWIALKSFGSRDIKQIHDTLPTKTPEQIKIAINYYKKKTLKRPNITAPTKSKEKKVHAYPRKPLANWAKFLTDSLSFEELQTETSAAVRMIADLENLPSSVCTENIDFKTIYHQIADAMEGKASPNNLLITEIINKCIYDTALTSKAFITGTSFKYLINSINMSEKVISGFPRPTECNEIATIRHLAAQRAYNPLNIPEEYLTASTHTIQS